MRVMVMVKATKNSEAGAMPSEKLLAEMGKYNEELVKAGVMLAAEGLRPSKDGVRIRFDGKRRTVTDGPFAETKELVAGFWVWQCKSKEEALEWLKRAPFRDAEVELRAIFEASKNVRAVINGHVHRNHLDVINGIERKPFPTIQGLSNIQRLMKLRNPSIDRLRLEDLIDDRILRRLDESGFIDALGKEYPA